MGDIRYNNTSAERDSAVPVVFVAEKHGRAG